uniref:Uncharacterized protein n=1 Tax=Anguilla anguilla TaxID=7936 RepID=A0A0E9V7T4_ANGAN
MQCNCLKEQNFTAVTSVFLIAHWVEYVLMELYE